MPVFYINASSAACAAEKARGHADNLGCVFAVPYVLAFAKDDVKNIGA
jgi:hypothetical protein